MKNSDLFEKWNLFTRFVKWVFAPKRWIGQEFKYYGKIRKVTAETYDSIQLEGIEHSINKRNYRNFNAGR